MKRHRIIRLPYLKISFLTNSNFLFDLVSRKLNFSKFKTNYKSPLSMSLNLLEEIIPFPNGRSDTSGINKNGFSFECWLKNIQLNIQPERNLITGKILQPNLFWDEEISDLLVKYPLRYILAYKNTFLVHGAGLSKNNKGILICGPFESGKSTLAIKLVENGFKFLSDEFTIFHQAKLFAFPLIIGLKRNTLKLFPRLRKLIKKAKENDEKISFDILDFYPGCIAESCIPKIIIFIAPEKKSIKAVIQPLDKEMTFALLCMDRDNVLRSKNTTPVHLKQTQFLAKLAKKTTSYFLSYSLDKISEAVRIIDNLLS